MGYKHFDGLSGTAGTESNNILEIKGSTVDLPDASFVRDAAIQRDGVDLVLDGPQGTLTIEGYFNAYEAPNLVAPNGETLTPELVNSFARSAPEFAQGPTMTDVSPVGAVDEISGEATITRLDGSVEPITLGTKVFQGDVIETAADAAVNIAFIDETSFAVSEEARLAIDEYVYDPATEAGSQNFSVLKGVFVFTSGLIGRDDPDDVSIETPSGSIGIRGTIIAGNVDTGEITVVEGAIVVRDNGGNEMTLATQFETARMNPNGGIENMGRLAANDVNDRFEGVARVSPTLFSSINDAAAEAQQNDAPAEQDAPAERPTTETRENFDADGTVDGNDDSEVDGTVDEGGEAAGGSDGTVAAADAPVEEVQPEMPPKMEMKNGMLGNDAMGTNVGGMNGPTPMMGEGNMMAAGMEATNAETMGEMAEQTAEMKAAKMQKMMETREQELLDTTEPLPTNTLNDPLPPPTTAVDNNANPVSVRGSDQYSTAPAGFFKTSFGQQFEYHFDKEFRDPDGSVTNLDYVLAGSTISELTTRFGAEGTGWDFNTDNGHLQIYNPAAGSVGGFMIRVAAIDLADGDSSGFQNYNFEVLNEDLGGTLGTTIVNSGQVYNSASAAGETVTIGPGGVVSGNTVFAGGGDDDITINQGSNNEIFLGNGSNQAAIAPAASNTGNKIFGGDQDDTITLSNVNNRIYGMDGNDVIAVDLGAGSTAADLQAAGNDVKIDGGFNNALTLGNPNGEGDTLQLLGNGQSLNFTNVGNDDYIKGIERLKLTGTGMTVTLNLMDVIEMTDHHNTLIIRADDDTLNFVGGGWGGFSKTEDVTLDDDAASGATSNFDMYTNGNVTLLIEDIGADNNATGATVTGLP